LHSNSAHGFGRRANAAGIPCGHLRKPDRADPEDGKFQHVYRSGDKDAASEPDLVTLRTTAQSFKQGSQKKREVTTVAGSSSITLKVQITDHAGQTLVDRDVQGKVRFFGENLRVTYDFSKKVATIVRDTF
jgi:hypothetical protein